MTGVDLELAPARTRVVSVLVVDDDPDHRDLITRRLGAANVRVVTAATGEEAVTMVQGVDVVLLDYKLGGRDGLDVLRTIRSRPRPPSVVMVTGMGSEEVVIECLRAGASDYVIKDRDYLASLPRVVERAWQHHDLERRAGELQRLALLVTSAPDRDGVLHEVIQGALRLLAADQCEIVLARDDLDLHTSSSTGAPDGELEELRVAVSMPETGPLGELIVRRRADQPFTAEEKGLASTFASFAAIAMAKLHQLELERSLVAELQQTLDVRRSLVAGVSHELRTPLTAISGFAQTLQMHWEKVGDDERQDMIGRIRSNAKDLSMLVEQLLDFASVEAGRLPVDVRAVALEPLALEAIGSMAPLLVERTVVVDVPAETTVWADPAIVRRTLYNLVTNAVKYTPAQAAIAVRAVALDGSDRVRLEVADTGDGLSPEEAARAFEPFWRAESSRSIQRGTGIGLALVRDYARLMGGEAGVDSVPGAGATFWVSLRRASS